MKKRQSIDDVTPEEWDDLYRMHCIHGAAFNKNCDKCEPYINPYYMTYEYSVISEASVFAKDKEEAEEIVKEALSNAKIKKVRKIK